MTIPEMLEQSGILTLLGIGIVFGFLIILIVVISCAGKIFRAMGGGQAAAGKGPSNNANVTAAIVAAVGAYRKTGKKG